MIATTLLSMGAMAALSLAAYAIWQVRTLRQDNALLASELHEARRSLSSRQDDLERVVGQRSTEQPRRRHLYLVGSTKARQATDAVRRTAAAHPYATFIGASAIGIGVAWSLATDSGTSPHPPIAGPVQDPPRTIMPIPDETDEQSTTDETEETTPSPPTEVPSLVTSEPNRDSASNGTPSGQAPTPPAQPAPPGNHRPPPAETPSPEQPERKCSIVRVSSDMVNACLIPEDDGPALEILEVKIG